MHKVIFDTNILVLLGAQGRDLPSDVLKMVGPFEGIVPGYVMAELGRLKSADAKTAASMLSQGVAGFAVEPLKKSKKTVDASLLDLAESRGAYLCTQDKNLALLAKARGIKTVSFTDRPSRSKGL